MTKTLAKQFDLLQVTRSGGSGSPYVLDNIANSGWRASGPTVFINDTYFDLAGLSMDAKTLFFEAAGMQEPYPIASAAATAGNNAAIMDIMTTSPLSDENLVQALIYGNLDASKLSFEQTVYFRYRVMSFNLDNVAGQNMVTTSDNQLGSLEPTASDRIYCYRVVSFGNNANGTYLTSGARYLLKATAKEEPEFEYLMRLKRSYDLQQEPDED